MRKLLYLHWRKDDCCCIRSAGINTYRDLGSLVKNETELRAEIYEKLTFLLILGIAATFLVGIVALPWYFIQSRVNASTEEGCRLSGGTVVRQFGEFSKCIQGAVVIGDE